jgi:hypothetical protein
MRRGNPANDRLPPEQAELQKSKTKPPTPRKKPSACFPPRTRDNPIRAWHLYQKGGRACNRGYKIRDRGLSGGHVTAKIEVEKTGEGKFRVRVAEGASETTHRVTVKSADYQRLTQGKVGEVELVRRSFEFLLENESKESILARFDLSVISRYFPQYEREIGRRLSC